MKALDVILLRPELIGFVLIAFLWFLIIKDKEGEVSKPYMRLLAIITAVVFFDALTLWMVNNKELFPKNILDMMHSAFYLTLLMSSGEMYHYVVSITRPNDAERLHRILMLVMVGYILIIPFLYIEYEDVGAGIFSSAGTGVLVASIANVVYVVLTLREVVKNRFSIHMNTVTAVASFCGFCYLLGVVQLIVKPLFISGSALSLIATVVFFLVEQGRNSFKQGALLGIYSDTVTTDEFNKKIAGFNIEFTTGAYDKYTIVCCAIDNLKKVFDERGCLEADKYTALIMNTLKQELRSVACIGRIQINKIVAVYSGVDESIVVSELNDVNLSIPNIERRLGYPAQLSVAYRVSGKKYKSLEDMLQDVITEVAESKSEIKSLDQANGGEQ